MDGRSSTKLDRCNNSCFQGNSSQDRSWIDSSYRTKSNRNASRTTSTGNAPYATTTTWNGRTNASTVSRSCSIIPSSPSYDPWKWTTASNRKTTFPTTYRNVPNGDASRDARNSSSRLRDARNSSSRLRDSTKSYTTSRVSDAEARAVTMKLNSLLFLQFNSF
jgi:hypothetical protein